MTENTELSRCYPWRDYNTLAHCKTSGKAEEMTNFSVTWTVPDSERLNYGWRTETRMFPTREAAMSAAERSMGVAFSVVAYEWDYSKSHTDPARRVTLYTRKNKNAKNRR